MSSVLSITAIAISISAPVALYIMYKRFEYSRILNYVRKEVDRLRVEFADFGKKYDDHTELGELSKKIALIEEKLGLIEKKVLDLENILGDKDVGVKTLEYPDEETFEEKVIELRKQGYSLKKIAEELKVSVSRVRKVLKEHNVS
ncbi:MAG: helix-turn-helix domain-containing protein [Ignisphaera sp.]